MRAIRMYFDATMMVQGRRWGSNEEPTTIKMRHFCLLIAFIAALDKSPCAEAAPFGRPRGTFRQSLSTSLPDEDDLHLQLEDTGSGKRRYPLLLQKMLGQIRGGSDDVGSDEATSGRYGNAKRRRRRRRKTRSSQDDVPDPVEEEPEDTPQAPAGDDEDEADKESKDGENKSWLESYLSGTGVADDEADGGATQNEPDDDDARTSVDAEKATSSSVEVQPTQDDDVENGSDNVAEPKSADDEDSRHTGQRRRRRRRSAVTTTTPAEEEEADQDDIVEEDDEQTTMPTGEKENSAVEVDIIPPEASDEVLAMEVNDSAGSGGRVKIRRRRRRRTQANAGCEQAEIVGEEEEAAPASNEDDKDDNVDTRVIEVHAELHTSSSPNDDHHEESAEVPSDGDAPSDPAEDVTANAESALEKEEPSNTEDMAEESDDCSEDVVDDEVGQKEDSTIPDREGIDDDETGGESSDTNSEGEVSEHKTEGADSGEDASDQSENDYSRDDAEKDRAEMEESSDSIEEANAEDWDASTSEDEDVDSENEASEDTSDDSSDKESDGEESGDSEESDSDSSNQDASSDNVVESEEEKTEDEETNSTSEAESSPAEESSDDADDGELSSGNGEGTSTVLETPVETDSPRMTEVEEEEEEDSNLASGDAPQDSTEVVEPTGTTEESSESSNEAKVDTCIEIAADNEEEVDDSTKITVSVVTWNLAEASPSEDEAKFLRRFRKAHPSLSSQDGRKGSDIVLIGGQETEDIKPRRAEGNRSRELRRLVIKMLGKDYVPIAIHSLGGVQFYLCVRREILGEIELCSVADVTCGIGNVFHNKGAICAYVQIEARNKKENSDGEDEESSTTKRQKSIKMLFVAAHMAAHVKNVDARNEDFWRIASELEAQAPPRFLRPRSPREQALEDAENGGGSHLMDSMDHVFFCGDLNYRIDLPREVTEYTVMQIEECLQQGNEKEADKLRLSLLRHDQLSRVMSEGATFPGFAEGKITFPPTFKFDKGTKSYDTSHKQRVPAFTDRILFKPFGVRVLEYRSEVDATHSDHRPVTGTFLVDIEGKKISEQNRRQKPRRRSRRKKSRPEVD